MSLDTFRLFLDQYARLCAPQLTFAWQGGEPTMMGLEWFQQVVEAQQRAGRANAILRPGARWQVGNALQTNGTLLDDNWARFFHQYSFLIGLSLDGPAEWHDRYRVDRHGAGQHEKVLSAVELLRRHRVEFNVLCVVSAANVDRPRELLRYYVRHGLDNLQFIPCVEPVGGHASDAQVAGAPQFTSYSITPQQYGDFLAGLFDAWMEVGFRKVRIRYFDNLIEQIVLGHASVCHLAESCGYIVLEHNGDCYPCDFFVEGDWKLGNIHETPLEAMLAGERFQTFARMKPALHSECERCEWRTLCFGECPRYRLIGTGAAEYQRSYFCPSYRRFFPYARKRLYRTAETVRRDAGLANAWQERPAAIAD